MKMNFLSKTFLFTICAAVMVPVYQPAFAATKQHTLIVNELKFLEIDQEVTDQSTITRAQFSQILCNLAEKTSSVDAAYLYAYPDVSQDYWAADYINTAVNNGWMMGSLSGYFNPDQKITYAQALYGVLKVVGFTDAQIPKTNSGIVSFAKKQGLCEGISLSSNNPISKSTCRNILYNALKVNINGNIFGSYFGCSLNASEEINVNEYISKNLKDPIIANKDWRTQIPFSLTTATIYRNDKKVKEAQIQEYDVLYYSISLKTIWAYSEKVTGLVKSLSPSSINPDTVQIGSKNYKLGTDEMKEEFSVLGNTDVGSNVTVMLGMDNSIVGILGKNDLTINYTGIILSSEEKVVDESLYKKATHITMVLPSGNEVTEEVEQDVDFYKEGEIVKVTKQDENKTIKKISRFDYQKIAGEVNTEGTMISSYTFASDIQILDYHKGNYSTVYPARLANCSISNDDILYYELNEDQEISKMILANTTHDMYTYGIMLNKAGSVVNSLVENKNFMLTFDDNDRSINFVAYEPAAFLVNGTELIDAFALTRVYIKSYDKYQVIDNNGNKYALGNDMTYYYRDNTSFQPILIDDVKNLSDYYIYGYCDKPVQKGGMIRLIVLEKKNK